MLMTVLRGNLAIKQSRDLVSTFIKMKDYILSNGIELRENYNKPKSDDSRQPGITPEKEKAITEALKHFKMI